MTQRGKAGWMLLALAICATAALVHRGMEEQRLATRPAELYEVVWQQINALRAADYSKAYTQVSALFQEHVDLEGFPELLRTEYSDLLSADRIEFGDVQISGRQARVQVYFILGNGDVVPTLYSLVHEDHGWKIDAARVQKRWPAGRHLGGLRS